MAKLIFRVSAMPLPTIAEVRPQPVGMPTIVRISAEGEGSLEVRPGRYAVRVADCPPFDVHVGTGVLVRITVQGCDPVITLWAESGTAQVAPDPHERGQTTPS